MGLTRITSDGITDATIATADLADQSVTLAKLPHGTSSNDGKFLRANNGADPTFETVNTDLSADSSPQLGGDLASNGNNINMADDDIINVGSGNDLRIRHNGVNSLIEDMGTGNLQIRGDDVHITGTNDELMAKFVENGAVEIYHNNTKRFETDSSGATVTGRLATGTLTTGGASTFGGSLIFDTNFTYDIGQGGTRVRHIYQEGNHDFADNAEIRMGNLDDFKIFHNGISNILQSSNGNIELTAGSEYMVKAIPNGAVELYYDNTKQLATHTDAIYIQTNADQGRIRLADTSGNIAYQITGQDVASSGESGGRLVIQDANGGIFLDARTSGGNCFVYNSLLLTGNGTADNLKLILGAGNDLELFFDGTHSRLKHTPATGDLVIQSDDIYLTNAAGNEYYFRGIKDGAAQLYYDNDIKLKTYSNGILSQGTGEVNILIGSTNAGGAKLILDGDSNGDASGSDYSYIYHDTSGDLQIVANNPSGNADIKFFIGAATLKARFDDSGNLRPENNNDVDLGNSNKRWRNIYTNDLNLSNEGGSNEVDGTWGSFTIQEGAEDLFLVNRRNGKKYKFNLTEVS